MTATPGPFWQRLLLGLALLLIAFELLPALDLSTSGWFWRSDGSGFWLRDSAPAQLVYKGTRYITVLIVAGTLALIVQGLLGRDADARPRARRAALVLLALALGPGLIVHSLLKDHWGRPRPVQIVDFGGSGHYVPPGLISDQCARNCSFVSGHASAGFMLAAGALLWPRQRRRWLAAGLVAGSLIGAVRIVQGGHFLSDVIGAGIVVLGTVSAVEAWARRRGWLPAGT